MVDNCLPLKHGQNLHVRGIPLQLSDGSLEHTCTCKRELLLNPTNALDTGTQIEQE